MRAGTATTSATEVIGKLPDADDAAEPADRGRSTTSRSGPATRSMLDVYPDVFAYGILLLPKDLKPGEKRPVVVCQHGLEGRPRTLHRRREAAGLQPLRRAGSPSAATSSTRRRTRTSARTTSARSAAQGQPAQAVALLASSSASTSGRSTGSRRCRTSTPTADRASTACPTAARRPCACRPSMTRYCLSICSGDFNEWVGKNVSVDLDRSYMCTGEYEMFEFDLGNTFNYAEMAVLIAPRPFMVERGHDDGVGTDEMVAYEYAKVRHLYANRLKHRRPHGDRVLRRRARDQRQGDVRVPEATPRLAEVRANHRDTENTESGTQRRGKELMTLQIKMVFSVFLPSVFSVPLWFVFFCRRQAADEGRRPVRASSASPTRRSAPTASTSSTSVTTVDLRRRTRRHRTSGSPRPTARRRRGSSPTDRTRRTGTRAGRRTASRSCSSRTAPASSQLWVIDLGGGEAAAAHRPSAPARATASGRRTASTSPSSRPSTRSSARSRSPRATSSTRRRTTRPRRARSRRRCSRKLFYRHWDELRRGQAAAPVRDARPTARTCRDVTPGDRDAYPTSHARSASATTSPSARTASTSSSPRCRRRTRRGAPTTTSAACAIDQHGDEVGDADEGQPGRRQRRRSSRPDGKKLA